MHDKMYCQNNGHNRAGNFANYCFSSGHGIPFFCLFRYRRNIALVPGRGIEPQFFPIARRQRLDNSPGNSASKLQLDMDLLALLYWVANPFGCSGIVTLPSCQI